MLHKCKNQVCRSVFTNPHVLIAFYKVVVDVMRNKCIEALHSVCVDAALHPLWSRIAIWVLVDREIGLCFAIRHLAMSRFWRVWVALIHCGGRRHAFFRVLQGPSQ